MHDDGLARHRGRNLRQSLAVVPAEHLLPVGLGEGAAAKMNGNGPLPSIMPSTMMRPSTRFIGIATESAAKSKRIADWCIGVGP